MKRLLKSGGIVAGVLGALVVAFVAGVMTGAGGVVAGGSPVSSASPSAIPSVVPSESPSPSGTPTPSAPGPKPVALFVGDSYTVGQEASPAQRWSTVVAREMGWTERNVAVGGTGFVSKGRHMSRLSYAEQLASVPDPGRIDIVLIAGGQNDFNELREDAGPVFDAVRETWADAARRFPHAQLIAVGPSTPWTIGLEARALDGVVRQAAQRHDATYVPLLDPDVVRKRFVTDDGVHVTNQGQLAIANRVLAQIS